jgi:hypothetical protein
MKINHSHYTQYLDEGYFIMPDFLSQDETILIKDRILNFTLKKEEKRKVITYHDKFLRIFDYSFYKNDRKFSLEYIKLSLLALKYSKLNNMITMKKTFNLGKLTRVDSYLSDVDSEDLTKWHADQAYGGATDPGIYFNGIRTDVPTMPVNRLFLYLTDVEAGNGLLYFLPRSHLIGIAIRKLINNGLIVYTPFYDLCDALEIVKKNRDLLIEHKLLNNENIEYFLYNAQLAIEGKFKFFDKLKAGSMIFFNDLGYHQGSSPSLSPRLVMRWWY